MRGVLLQEAVNVSGGEVQVGQALLEGLGQVNLAPVGLQFRFGHTDTSEAVQTVMLWQQGFPETEAGQARQDTP